MARVVKHLKGEPHFHVFGSLSAIVSNSDVVAASSTSVTVATDDGYRLVFKGSFSVNGLAINGGTATAFDLYAGSTRILKADGYAATVDQIGDAFDGGLEAFFQLFFSNARINGSKADDFIYGGAGARVFGKGGEDRLHALPNAAAVLKGGAGDDVLVGNGTSKLFGNKGDDMFVVGLGAGNDRIRDFKLKDDVVALPRSQQYDDVPVGYLDDIHFRTGKQAKTADHHVIYDRKTGALYYDADGAGGLAQTQIARLPDGLKLKADHILVADFI